jgi:hypothetical protein
LDRNKPKKYTTKQPNWTRLVPLAFFWFRLRLSLIFQSGLKP